MARVGTRTGANEVANIDPSETCPSCGSAIFPSERRSDHCGNVIQRIEDSPGPELVSSEQSSRSDPSPPSSTDFPPTERRAIQDRALTRYAQAGWRIPTRLNYSAEVSRWSPPERRRIGVDVGGALTDQVIVLPLQGVNKRRHTGAAVPSSGNPRRTPPWHWCFPSCGAVSGRSTMARPQRELV